MGRMQVEQLLSRLHFLSDVIIARSGTPVAHHDKRVTLRVIPAGLRAHPYTARLLDCRTLAAYFAVRSDLLNCPWDRTDRCTDRSVIWEFVPS